MNEILDVQESLGATRTSLEQKTKLVESIL